MTATGGEEEECGYIYRDASSRRNSFNENRDKLIPKGLTNQPAEPIKKGSTLAPGAGESRGKSKAATSTNLLRGNLKTRGHSRRKRREEG